MSEKSERFKKITRIKSLVKLKKELENERLKRVEIVIGWKELEKWKLRSVKKWKVKMR